MKMDNLLKSPHEMSAHSHLPTISSHRRLIFHAKKGGVSGRKNWNKKCICQPLKWGYLSGWKRKTCYITSTFYFCLSLGYYLILIHFLAFPTSTCIVSKLGPSFVSRPPKTYVLNFWTTCLPSDTGFHCDPPATRDLVRQKCSRRACPSLQTHVCLDLSSGCPLCISKVLLTTVHTYKNKFWHFLHAFGKTVARQVDEDRGSNVLNVFMGQRELQ